MQLVKTFGMSVHKIKINNKKYILFLVGPRTPYHVVVHMLCIPINNNADEETNENME